MDAEEVRSHAQAYCDALLEGNVDRAIEELSPELHQHVGELISQIPLPLTEATVESVEVGGKGYIANLVLVGESGTVKVLTRWKDRDGTPTLVEASHVVDKPAAPPEEAATEEPAAEG
ncbi:MAG: hypothetical protein QOJ81_1230 [Chloroflexota bacterium]|jgi:hypothetical protein|nr:hypothetical protein [Chloroflexota bacterium]